MKFLSRKPRAPTTYVYVDYEHWFYSMKKNYNVSPTLDTWVADLKKKYYIPEIYFFADYSDPDIYREVDKLRKISNYIIDTSCNPKNKNDTDFIMLDFLYQKAALLKRDETFILLTGDSHFTYVVMYLVRTGHPVGVYGVKNSVSQFLTEQASWYEIIDGENVADMYYKYILEYFKEKENGYFKIQHTFAKTSQLIAERYNLDINTVKTAIQQMKNDGYIDSYSEKSRNHNYNVDALYVNWNEAKNAGLIV